jgi:hypothetical protein
MTVVAGAVKGRMVPWRRSVLDLSIISGKAARGTFATSSSLNTVQLVSIY